MSNFLETYITKFKTWANAKICTEAEMQAYVDYYLLTCSKQPIIDAFVNSLSSETQSAIEDYLATVIVVSISATGVANRGSVASYANVVLTATAENVPEGATPIYAWQKLSGAEYVNVTTDDGTVNGNTLTPTLTAGTHTYRAVVTVNNTNYTTDNFTFTVHQPYTANNVSVAIFTISPSNVNLAKVMEGTDVTFRAFPTPANLTYTYQWYLNGAAVTGATNATYTYTAPAAGTIGYVKCVATLDATGIYKDPNWNGERNSNTAIVTAIVNPNALGKITSLYVTGITKYTATLNWTQSNPNNNVVIYLKNMATTGEPALPENGVPQANSVFTTGIQAVYVGGINSVTVSGLAKANNYTAFAFICNSDYSQNTIEPVRVTFKTNAF